MILQEQTACYDGGLCPFASCVGVAAAAGEVAKDKKHLAVVEKVGSDFFCTNFWSVDTFCPESYMYTIANCTTPSPPKSGQEESVAAALVQLWTNNAKIILCYWVLQGLEDDDNSLFCNHIS